MKTQLQHHTTTFPKKQFPIHLVCDRIQSPANIGGVFRVADSFGISKLHFCGVTVPVGSKRMERTARATHKIVPFCEHEETLSCIQQLKNSGYTIVALEITTDSIPITTYTMDTSEKIALIIGEESSGVAPAILAEADYCLHIPMYGNNSSMNVTTATGIALYELTKQLIQ